MKIMTQYLSHLLSVVVITSVCGLCLGMPDTAHAQQNIAITVTTTAQQSFDGFGISIGNPIGEFLPKGGRKGTAGSVSAQIYDRLFQANNANSVNLSFLRLPVMASNYKYTAQAGYDFATAVEKTGEGDIIRAARARNGGLKIMFSSWTPPYYMKYNNADFNPDSNDSTDPNISTTNRLKTDQYTNYANLLKSFCDNFNTTFGFYPHALSLQNEPDTNVKYSSCVFTSDQYKGLLTAARNAFPWDLGYPTKLWGPELGSNQDSGYIGAVATAGLLDAVSQHSYNGDTGLILDWAKNNLKVNQTEFCPLNKPFYNNDQPLIAAASINRFCKDANKGKVSSWFHWDALGIKLKGNPAPSIDFGQYLIVTNSSLNPDSVYNFVDQANVATQGVWNLNNNTLYPADGSEYSPVYKEDFSTFQLTSQYYAFRRLTQAVTPGSVSRWTTVSPNYYQGNGSQDSVYASGFKRPDGKYCLVIANQSQTVTFNSTLKIDALAGTGWKSFKTYYTSVDNTGPVNDVSWIIRFNNGQTTATLYPRSVSILVQQ
jgi:hypothetical protein